MAPTQVTDAPTLASTYAFWEENPAAVDVQPTKGRVTGPSPFAFSQTEGPSVLKDWQPKRASGALDSKYKFIESTPQIGREYLDVDLSEVLNNEELLNDLAVIVAERGVVFFRNQNNITTTQHKELVQKLGVAAGKPKTSGLHIHPTALAGGYLDGDKIDPEVSFISSRLRKKLYLGKDGEGKAKDNEKENESVDPYSSNDYTPGVNTRTLWHTDISFEPVPADFSSLRIVETKSGTGTASELAREGGGPIGGSGGDTLWASGYGLAEKLSPKFLAFLEGLTGVYAQPRFREATDAKSVPLYTAPRGAPENVGDELIATHSIVRTNPTTGWKSVFAIGAHFSHIKDLTPGEAEHVKKHLLEVLVNNPDLQVRFKWNPNDIAIWDNRSSYHTAVPESLDADGSPLGERTGLRAVSIGERPFFDAERSQLRTDSLKARNEARAAVNKV